MERVRKFLYLISPILFIIGLIFMVWLISLGNPSSENAVPDDPRDALNESPYDDEPWGL